MEDSLKAVTQLVNWVEIAEEASQDSREKAERDRDYYDNKQWTDTEKAILEKRRQPIVTINRIKRKVEFLSGIEKQQRSDPKAYPRTPNEEESAEAATDSIRFVVDNTNFDVTRSAVWENLLIEGMGGCELGIEYRGDQPEITIKYWPWDRLGYDPHSSRPDFSDARYTYGILWMDADEAGDKWPDKRDILDATMREGSVSDTYDDRPRYKAWADNKKKRVKVVQMYYKRAGQWHSCIFTRAGKLSGGPVPFRDEHGKSFNPMILTSAYVDRENNRYGAVREMISPQDEINKRRSKLLHQLTMRQTMGDTGAVDDITKMKRELARPDGHIEVAPNQRFEILRNEDQVSGQAQLLQEAKMEIDLMGPNASMTGKSGREASGRSIIAQQQGGYIELAPLLDRLKQFNKSVYRAIWSLVRQYWTAERWVRVTDNEQNMKFVGLNQPVTAGQKIMEEMQRDGLPPEEMQATLEQLRMHPAFNQVAEVKNRVADIMVDIIVEDAPDNVTIQQEQFDEIVKLVQAGVQLPPDLIIQASQLRNKKALLDSMKGGNDPEAAQRKEMEKRVAELEVATREAAVRKTMADAALREAQASSTAPQLEMGAVKAEIDLKNAQTVKTMVDAHTFRG